MLLTEAGCGLIAFILCISGIHGQTHICVLHGSSVNLTCSTKNLTSSNKWFTEDRTDSELLYKELSADERYVVHASDENQPTLTIRNLTKSDANVYCCGNTTEDPDLCRHRSVQLSVTDLQVTKSPVMSEHGGYDIKLMCSTSCNLTESPSAYIWYSDEKSLNEKKSFYYARVNRNKKVTYSCAVKEHFKLKSPGVSLGPKNDRNQTKTDRTATAAAAGASAALLVVIPAVVFIWIRTNRTLQHSSTTGEGDITPQLNSSHIYENIPVQPLQHDDVNYSTINFQPKEREHGAYAVVCFRPDV